jgi:large subunit ribosomal protein L23
MSILVKPIITEKATDDSELRNAFSFVVDRNANKIQIKEAVETAYGVTVEGVRTLNVIPKIKSRYTKTGMVTGKTSAYKKAIIKVAEGETIDLYSNL